MESVSTEQPPNEVHPMNAICCCIEDFKQFEGGVQLFCDCKEMVWNGHCAMQAEVLSVKEL